MKHSFKYSNIFILIIFYSLGCSKDPGDMDCSIGYVIDYDNCKKAALIQVENPTDLGKEIIFVDDSLYSNAIQVPGETGVYGEGKFYFQYTDYNIDTDSDLFNSSGPPCPSLYDIMEVPIFVITDFSTTGCP